MVLALVLAGVRKGFRLDLWRRVAVPDHQGSIKVRICFSVPLEDL